MASFSKEFERTFKDLITKIKKGTVSKEEKILPIIS